MRQSDALQRLNDFDRRGRYVFTSGDLDKIFDEDTPRARQATLKRLLGSGILERPVKGVYLYSLSKHKGPDTVELIAKTLRRGEYSYVSLESALSEYGAISQIPINRISLMTTGRKGEYKTPYGVIEFTHTKRRPSQILSDVSDRGRPLKVATLKTALRDLKRVGRNTHLVDQEMVNEYG